MTAAAAIMPVATAGILLASVRLFIFMVWTLLFVPFIALVKALGFKTAHLRRYYFRGLCCFFGMHVVTHGLMSEDRPLLIASNHISYLDILAFGSVLEAEFLAKAEVSDWPIFGTMARVGDTVFVERRRTRTAEARDHMNRHLAEHRSLIFFPEATSGDGNHMLPFKSALFNVAEDMAAGHSVTVQPAAIAYTRLNGLPMGCGWRSFCAWYGDMGMVSHLWRFLQLGHTTVEIALLEPITTAGEMNRKALAAAAERASKTGFNQLISGRIAL